jgi:hypothetical protein
LRTADAGKPLADVTLERTGDGWRLADGDRSNRSTAAQPAKRPGMQGPIDDVFLEPFLVVAPSGEATHPAIGKWVELELEHFRDRWRALMRGELRVKRDDQVTADDIARYHLVVWGDPASNAVLRRALNQPESNLPLRWTPDMLHLGREDYEPDRHVPLMIYPNPLNPRKYLVCNSGLTFREAHDRTNSLQNPKLPDWAVLDVSQLPTDRAAGRVVDAGFFDERWQWRPAR